MGGGVIDSSSEVGQALEGCHRESKGVCGSFLEGSQEGEGKTPRATAYSEAEA